MSTAALNPSYEAGAYIVGWWAAQLAVVNKADAAIERADAEKIHEPLHRIAGAAAVVGAES